MGTASLNRGTVAIPIPVSCHFQGYKALLRTGKRRYIKYHAFFALPLPLATRSGTVTLTFDLLGHRTCR